MWFSHQKKWKLKIKSYLKIKKETCLNYTGNVAGPLNIHLKRPEILFSNSLIQRSPNIFRGHRMECSFTSYWLLPLFDLFFLSKWLYNNKILNHSISVLRTQLDHLASLAKWLSVRLRTKWFWVRVQLQSL